MLALKLMGACMLALAGWFGGAAVSARASTHRAALGQTVGLMKTLEEEIAFRRANLNAIYQQLAQRGAFPLLGLVSQVQVPCHGAQVAPPAQAQGQGQPQAKAQVPPQTQAPHQPATKGQGGSATAPAQFQALAPPQCFAKEERAAFCACFARLGYTGAQQECERLARYRKQFEGFYAEAQKHEQSALAIDRKIGLALGSMVALLLL